MFIIEGPDCVGKTTVADKVVEMANSYGSFPIYYQHMTRPPRHFDFCFHYLDMMSKYAVMDRFHLGALAYHPADTLPAYQRKFVESQLYQKGSIIVIMYASNPLRYREKLEAHASQRKEMFDFDVLVNANAIFTELALSGNYDYTWDITQSNYPDSSIEFRYPDKEVLKTWIETWFKSLHILEMWKHGGRID